MDKFIKWFFTTPTSIITLISIIIAFLAYVYQKKEKRKYNSYLIAKEYSNSIIPKLRFITCISENILGKDIFKLFCDKKFDRWNETELNLWLEEIGLTTDKYNDLLSKVSLLDIKKAIFYSHIDMSHYTWYNLLIQSGKPEPEVSIELLTFVYDFLNELEAIALSLRYNLADEKIIYQSLHQTLLNRMPCLYYFIAFHNTLDERRYYTNLIWLYNKWLERDEKQKKRVKKRKVDFAGHKL